MKVLVTGGAGFIGSVVVRKLLSRGHSVRIFDLPTSIARFGLDEVESISGDILDLDAVLKASEGCDAVIHMAAMMGVKNTEERPQTTALVNIQGTLNVVESVRKNGLKKIVFTSSSEVYGEPEKVPIEESDRTLPKSVYGVSKLVSEGILRQVCGVNGIAYCSVRLFNIYGAGQKPDYVVPRFVQLAVSGDPLTVYGDGSQIRAFNNVEDGAEGIVLALEKDSANGNEVNVGNDTEPISMADLAKRVVSVCGSASEVKLVPFEESGNRKADREINKRVPSIKKAREILGYSPVVSLDDGIKSIAEDLRGVNNVV